MDPLEMLDYLVNHAQVVNPEIMMTVFINQAHANPRASEVQDVKAFTRNFENILLAGSVICDRIVFCKAIQEGFPIMEQKDRKAIQEITQLYKEVFPPDGH
ncbi:MAG: hypothetical protein ACOC1Q_03300 [Desulfosalsimonas sp.]